MKLITIDPQEITRVLKKQPRLSTWPAEEIDKLATEIQVYRFAAGETIFQAHTPSDDAYIVYKGRVRQSVDNDQKKEWWYSTRSPGDIFVQQALFRSTGHPSTAKAETLSELFRIRASILSQLLIKHPELWSLLQHDTSARLQSIPLLRGLNDPEIDQISVSTDVKEFAAGESICKLSDPEGALWIIDWGQVKITGLGQLGFQGGNLGPGTPNDRTRLTQGFEQIPHILTAGNWFVSGPVKLPQQLIVAAEAQTQVKLLRIPGYLLEKFEENFEDVRYLLRHRLNIAARLQQALSRSDYFRQCEVEHYRSLATITGWEHVPAGLDVSRQGEKGGKVYVLATGSALVKATDDTGRERPRHFMSAGVEDFYGIQSMTKGERHDATVRSISSEDGGRLIDGSDWLTLARDDLRYLMQTTPDLWAGTVLYKELMEKPKAKQFEWLEDEELVHLVTRQHPIWLWLRLLGVAGVIAAILGGLWLLSRIGAGTVAIATYLLVGMVLAFLPTIWFVIDYYNDFYVITSKRVVRRDRVLFIHETQLEAPLERIQDLTVTTSLLAKIFNYGRLDIRTAGLGGDIPFDMVPRPDEVEGMIRSMQRMGRASAKAEQQENLRNRLLSGLKMRLLPQVPERVLPAGTEPPVQRTAVQAALAPATVPLGRFGRWLRRLPGRIAVAYTWLLPQRAREQVLKERDAKAKKKAAERAERIIVYRKHIFFLIRDALIPITLMAVTLVVVLLVEPLRNILTSGFNWFMGGLLVWFGICAFWLWFFYENWHNDQYILTKTHVIDITALPLGLFEQRRQAEWDKVQNANYEMPTFWSNLFNFGTVTLQTAAVVGGKLDFIHVPNPRKVQQEVFQYMEAARQAKTAKDIAQQQQTLSETLEIYAELQREWTERGQGAGGRPSTTTRTGL